MAITLSDYLPTHSFTKSENLAPLLLVNIWAFKESPFTPNHTIITCSRATCYLPVECCCGFFFFAFYNSPSLFLPLSQLKLRKFVYFLKNNNANELKHYIAWLRAWLNIGLKEWANLCFCSHFKHRPFINYIIFKAIPQSPNLSLCVTALSPKDPKHWWRNKEVSGHHRPSQAFGTGSGP